MKRPSFLQIDAGDNLVVALQHLAKGTTIRLAGRTVTLREDIPAKQKFSLEDRAAGDPASMYGIIVGRATRPIAAGELITTANLEHATAEWAERHRALRWTPPPPYAGAPAEFMGYRRGDGRAGTANHWLFVPLVFCSNRELDVLRQALVPALGYEFDARHRRFTETLVDRIRAGGSTDDPVVALESFSGGRGQLFANVDGLGFLTHHLGCGATPDEAEELCALLANYITHPNTAGATVLSLGCQKAEAAMLADAIRRRDPGGETPVFFYDRQSWQGPGDMLEAIIRQTLAALEQADRVKRQPVPVEELVIGVECGGSDGFSGISANPVIGRAVDHLIARGGSAILSEFPELCGVENEIVARCVDRRLGEAFLRLMSRYRDRVRAVGFDFDRNPSPGNIRDGLITDAMKSAGAAKKGGTAPIVDVLDYPGRVEKRGLTLLCTPGGDVESTTALAGAGATLIIFSTGLGTPTGNPIVPVLKVSSNSDMARRLASMIDFDAGPIISGERSIDDLAAALEKLCVETASGRYRTKAARLGQDDFIPWKRGVSL